MACLPLLLLRQLFPDVLAKKYNTVEGTARNRQAASGLAKKRAGLRKIRGGRTLTMNQISEQIDKGKMMSSAGTAGSLTAATHCRTVGGQIQFMHEKLVPGYTRRRRCNP